MTDRPQNANDILVEAARLVGGDREATHGDKLDNFNRIAAAWNGILIAAGKAPATPLNAHDVCNLMEVMKVARRYSGSFNADDYTDGGGYAGCAYEVRLRSSEG